MFTTFNFVKNKRTFLYQGLCYCVQFYDIKPSFQNHSDISLFTVLHFRQITFPQSRRNPNIDTCTAYIQLSKVLYSSFAQYNCQILYTFTTHSEREHLLLHRQVRIQLFMVIYFISDLSILYL